MQSFLSCCLLLTAGLSYAQQQVWVPGFVTDNRYEEYRTMSMDSLRSIPVKNKKITGVWENVEVYYISENGEASLLESTASWIMTIEPDHTYELDISEPTGEFYWTLSERGDTLNLHPIRSDSTFYVKPYTFYSIVKCNSRKLVICRQQSAESTDTGFKLVFRRRK